MIIPTILLSFWEEEEGTNTHTHKMRNYAKNFIIEF